MEEREFSAETGGKQTGGTQLHSQYDGRAAVVAAGCMGVRSVEVA